MTPSVDPASELARLRRKQRIWTWVAVVGVVITAWSWLGRPSRRAPAAPQPSDMSEASDPSDLRASPAASALPAGDLVYGNPDPGDDTFSFQLVQRRFANAFPEIEVLPREGAHNTRLAGKYLQEAMSAMIHAPGKMNGRQTMICDIFMIRDAAGTGTVLNVAWACRILIRHKADSAFLADAKLPYIVWPSFNPAMAETGTISLRDAVNLCAPLYR